VYEWVHNYITVAAAELGEDGPCVIECCSVLQCVAVCCSVLQCVASVLQCVAGVFQCCLLPNWERMDPPHHFLSTIFVFCFA